MAAVCIHTLGGLMIGYCIGMALFELLTRDPAPITLNLRAPVRTPVHSLDYRDAA